MSGCARVDWTVDRSLEYAENPHSCTGKSERVLALEVRRLRMVEIDLKQDVWDWQRRAEEAEEKLSGLTKDHLQTHDCTPRPTVHAALGITPEHAAYARREWGDGE